MWLILLIVMQIQQLQPVPPFEPTKEQLIMHKAHSEFRIKNGLEPQILHPKLCELAQAHSVEQHRRRRMYHSNYPYNENVAYGASPEDSIKMWINSRGHRANLLSGHKYCGFGYSGIYATSLHANMRE